MRSIELLAVIVWKGLVVALLAVTLMSIIEANRPIEPASWSPPSHTGNPFAGPVVRTG